MSNIKNLDGLVVYHIMQDELGVLEYSETFSQEFGTTLFLIRKGSGQDCMELFSSQHYLLALGYTIIGEL